MEAFGKAFEVFVLLINLSILGFLLGACNKEKEGNIWKGGMAERVLGISLPTL